GSDLRRQEIDPGRARPGTRLPGARDVRSRDADRGADRRKRLRSLPRRRDGVVVTAVAEFLVAAGRICGGGAGVLRDAFQRERNRGGRTATRAIEDAKTLRRLSGFQLTAVSYQPLRRLGALAPSANELLSVIPALSPRYCGNARDS